MFQAIRRFVAQMFGLYTEQAIAPQPIVIGLSQAEQIVTRLNGNGRKPDSHVLSAIRVAGTVLGIQDNFDDEVEEARQYADEDAAEQRVIAEQSRLRASAADKKAYEFDQRSQQLTQLASLFA